MSKRKAAPLKNRTEWEFNYREIFNAVNDAILVQDLHTGKILDVNRKGCELSGYSAEEIRRCTMEDLSSGEPPYTQREAMKNVKRVALGEPLLFEWRAKDRSGRIFWVEVNLKRVCLSGKDYLLAVMRDISDRKRLEAELVQAHKMEAVGKLAGGIAHDFNNLLNVMSGYCELMLMRMSPQHDLRRDIENIQACAATAADLTKQLLAFSRRETITPTVLDFNKTVADFANLLPRLLGEDIEVVTATSEVPPFVKASPVQIRQIIMNLAVNARDAMPNGGKLIIQTTSSEQDVTGTHACLSITDTGIGMDEATRSRIFEPYFSTKEKGKGTGLGLAVVYGIVEQNGGRVVVDSAPGRGTTVQIYWPEVKPPTETVEPSPVRPSIPRGSETILLVEDYEGLRQMTRSFLEMQGYKVLEACNGTEAVRSVHRYDDRIDLLLTDVIMPGMNGAELAERLNKLRPGIAVLFVSGYAADVLHKVSRAGVLDKPFTFESLARKIREVLGKNPGQKIA